jgi:choline dehydrogenase
MTAYDYIIVGSGAGGGPLAANLARSGFSVLLLEAGGDPCSSNELGRLLYEVPIFHGLSTEYKECSWNFFVRHYTDDAQQKKDTKFVPEENGVFYPRAGTLGGCTAHNAMITVTPQAMDWDGIARETGDLSWCAHNMFRYFARLEDARYVARPGTFKYSLNRIAWKTLAFLGNKKVDPDASNGHGFTGWLTTSEADPRLSLPDWTIVKIIVNAVGYAFRTMVGNPLTRLITGFDPNDVRNSDNSPEGVALTPLAVRDGKRNGPREFLLKTRDEHPDRLKIQLHALATRVLFEGTTAVGIEYLEGEHLYEADPSSKSQSKAGVRRQVFARREVILAAGAFNTPQLLMLSGIGPADELRKHGIPVLVDLPGVGANLQDRYEVPVISATPEPFKLLEGALFEPPEGRPDPCFDQWKKGQGLYTSNGSLLGILKRSRRELPEPDLYIFALPGYFPGYKPGYAQNLERFRNRLTWAILKAYTNNRAGRVTLRSKDPTKVPQIDFRYFSEGSDETGADIDAVVDGMEFVRLMNAKLGTKVEDEIWPGPKYDTREKLREFAQNEAWGHHASCTAKIGAKSDPMAVLDSRFRVRGVERLRVVDASVFPRIPGYFIVSAVYMISEKAADVIAEDSATVIPRTTSGFASVNDGAPAVAQAL